jgi:hypothetical protein
MSANPYIITRGILISEVQQMEQENLDAQERRRWQEMSEAQQLEVVSWHWSSATENNAPRSDRPLYILWGAWGGQDQLDLLSSRKNPLNPIMHVGVAGFCRILMHTNQFIQEYMNKYSHKEFNPAVLQEEVEKVNSEWLNATDTQQCRQKRRQLVDYSYTLTPNDDASTSTFKKLFALIIEDSSRGFKVKEN